MRAKIFIILLLLAAPLWAEDGQKRIHIVGRESAVVTTNFVRLSDLADIRSASAEDDDVVIGLQKLQVANSPTPGKDISLSAGEVLEAIGKQGVNLTQVGYTLPRTVKVIRAGSLLPSKDIENAIEKYLRNAGRDVVIKRLEFPSDIMLAPGDIALELNEFETHFPGKIGFNVSAVSQDTEAKFQVEASVDEWMEIPVASRPISKGAMLASHDMAMARLNINSVARDVLKDRSEIIGKEATKGIQPGEAFSQAKIDLPAIITSGSRVTMVCRQGMFEATATGVALENAARGHEIKIKNESSKRVVQGIAIEPGLVEVKP